MGSICGRNGGVKMGYYFKRKGVKQGSLGTDGRIILK
jgi:hypothetical protein